MNTNNIPYFPPRKQQGFAETCQANALAAACQMLKIRGGYPDEDLSRMYLFDLSAVHEGLPVGSKAALASLFWVGETLGIPPESLYPYNDGHIFGQPSPDINNVAATQKITHSYSIPVDQYNPTATFTSIKAAMAQGHSVVMTFKLRQWFAMLAGPEEGMLAIEAAVVPGSADDLHIANHCVVIGDVYDDFHGQGQAMAIVNSIGNGINEREVQIVSPRFLLDAIELRAVFGFAQATDRYSYDAEGVPGQVYRLYRAAFDRTPDKGGLGYHIDNMTLHGLTLAQVAAQFIASPEFTNKYGALSNRAFVMQLYLNVLHRNGDVGGIDFHTANLDSGALTRADTLVSFSASPEYQATTVAVFNAGVAYV